MNPESKKAVKSIGRSIANINKQIAILRKEFLEAMMYVEDGVNYQVMSGSPHESVSTFELKSHQERVLDSFMVIHSDCGAW